MTVNDFVTTFLNREPTLFSEVSVYEWVSDFTKEIPPAYP